MAPPQKNKMNFIEKNLLQQLKRSTGRAARDVQN